MGVALQLRRGTTAEVTSFTTGSEGELILDTTTKALYVIGSGGTKHIITGGSGGSGGGSTTSYNATSQVLTIDGVPYDLTPLALNVSLVGDVLTIGDNAITLPSAVSPVIDATNQTITGVDASGNPVTISVAQLGTTVVDNGDGTLTITNPDGSLTTVTLGGSGGTTIIENAIPSGTTLPTTDLAVGQFFYITTSNLMYFYDGTAWVTSSSQAVSSGVSTPTTGALGELFFDTSTQALMQHNGTEWVRVTPDPVQLQADITTALETSTPLANTILANLNTDDLKGVKTVTTLPTNANSNVGDVVFLDTPAPTGQKLYTFSDHDGNGNLGWESKVAFGDLTGNITADQIGANKIVASNIMAGAITAAKIETGAITANKISAGAIGADQIAANAITSNKVAANAIYANAISAGAISTSHMGANSISGDRIQAGTLSAGKIDANGISCTYLNGGTANVTGGGFSLGGAGGSIGGHTGLAAFNSDGSKYGLIAAGGTKEGIACGTTNYDASAIVAVGGADTTYSVWRTLTALGHKGQGLYSTYQSAFTEASRINTAKLSISTHAGYFEGDVTVTGTYNPFTGAHDALIEPDTAMEGDIVVDVEVIAKVTISDTLTKVGISTTPNQKGAVGIFNTTKDKSKESNFPAAFHSTTYVESDSILPLEVKEIKPEFQAVFDAHDLISINSLGEGQVNVCGEGGNLEIGDLIVTSSIQGKGKKQGDDIIRSTTVAKVRENVTFSTYSEVKQVACIYLCG